MDDLEPCPCGKTPTKLVIMGSAPCKWAHASGDCCGEWMIEFRSNYLAFDDATCIAHARAAWHDAPRANPALPQVDDARVRQPEKTLYQSTCKDSLNVVVGSGAIWLVQIAGQYDVRRTSHNEPGAVEYIPAAEYKALIGWLSADAPQVTDAMVAAAVMAYVQHGKNRNGDMFAAMRTALEVAMPGGDVQAITAHTKDTSGSGLVIKPGEGE